MRCLFAVSAAGLLVSLAGCGQPQPAPAANTAAPAAEHGVIARVKALSPRQRDGVLFRAIHAGGGAACQDTRTVADQPPTKAGNPAWLVTCTDGGQWYVELHDDGTALVTGARAGG